MTNSKEIKVWQPLALSIMLAIGMMFGYKMNNKDQGSLIEYMGNEENHADVGQVEELIRFVESRYVDSIDRSFLTEKAINSILDELDPHSVYISPEQINRINNEMEGNFRGIGIEIFYFNDTVNIIKTIDEGPAEKAGIRQFDRIISINDSLVAGNGMQFSDIRKMLRGDDGDRIKIKLLNRDNVARSVDVLVSDIPVKSVTGGLMLDDKTGYINILRFGSKTYREFMDLFQDLVEKQNMKNVIIDVRDNPGGYLPQVTNILSQLFKEKEKLLVYTNGNNDRKLDYKTTGKVFFPIDKIAVLINENSASGSEIIAGAIQDWDRGVIIGRRSFGKGLVQEQYDLNNGGAIRLTVARYYTPSGRSIQRSYEDLSSYYSDFEYRYNHGELFAKDSMERGDKVVYKTMGLKRPVFGGGGITPDIFIPIDSVMFEPFYREVINELPQYVFKKMSHHSDTFEIDNLSEDILQEYILDKSNSKNSTGLTKNNKNIKLEIKKYLIKYSQGAQSVDTYVLPQDDFIKASLNYFYSENLLTDLLEVKTLEK
ncbi:MAG: S41 family peptidase [Saprospiraceae bacterium]